MKLRITVEGKVYDVDVEVLDEAAASAPPSASRPAPTAPAAPAAPAEAPRQAPASATDEERGLRSPIAGSILQVNVAKGEEVSLNQVLMVMEAMKMETNIASPQAGKIAAVHVASGDAVKQGQLLVEFE